MKTHLRSIRNIYIVAGTSLFLLVGSFYFFGFQPLSDRLRSEHTFEIEHFLDSSLWIIQGVINKHFDLSRQSASRTAIRKKQISFLNGETTLDQLVAFSAPKLDDALFANEDIIGISRFDSSGKLLFHVGRQLPNELIEKCNLESLESVNILNPIVIDGVQRLIYCSPIVDSDYGRVGSDILIMSDQSIQNIIQFASPYKSALMILGMTSGGKIIYWPSINADSQAHEVFNNFIKNGEVEKGYIIRTKKVRNSGWYLYAVINEEGFFADINRQLLLLISVIIGIAILLLALTVLALRPIIRTLLKEQKLLEQSHRDGLTNLYNHVYMEELLDHELSRALRYKRPLSILMFDVDHFKLVNDTNGHLAGDDVLREIANLSLNISRKEDICARYGGEEFLIILPEIGKDAALIFAERLRTKIAVMQVGAKAGNISVTISIGLLSYNTEADDSSMQDISVRDIIQLVDKALYTSKSEGRNKVTAVTLP
ncbi:MAG: GGDEF domain-containing protein [Candidatus Thiodiazotropha sp. 6PLUC2]